MMVDLMWVITGEREIAFSKEKQQMKTHGTIHLLTTGRLLALAMLLTILLTTLASCAPAPVSSPVTAAPETAPVGTALSSTGQAMEKAETAISETSPAEIEVTSPGYGLEGPRLVVQLPDNSIVFVSLDGQQAPIAAEAPKGLFATGFGRHAMQDGPMIYARSAWVQPDYYVIDTLSGKVLPLEFIPPATNSLAVRSLADSIEPVDPPASLAWGTLNGEGTPSTSLHVTAPDGTDFPLGEEVSDVTSKPLEEFAFVPLRWGLDGNLYYSRMPLGIGGYIPYVTFSDLWRYDLTTGENTQLVPSPGPGRVCLDELSADARLLASTCEIGEIQVLDLRSDERTTIRLPEGLGDAQPGSVRFSPGGDRLVYGMYIWVGPPDETSTAVAISDGLSGASTVIAESDVPGFFAPLAWLDEETILVHFNPADDSAPASLWKLKADGSEFTPIVEGGFLGVLE
jgi:hypothetical protein